MKQNWIHKTIALFFGVLIALPFLVQGIHAIEQHEHTICLAETEQHFHEIDFDCSIYHITVEHESDLFKTINSLHDYKNFKNSVDHISEFIPSRIINVNLTRGPPQNSLT